MATSKQNAHLNVFLTKAIEKHDIFQKLAEHLNIVEAQNGILHINKKAPLSCTNSI